MALSPALTVTNLQPIAVVPVPVGTTFGAGEVLVRGTPSTDTATAAAFALVTQYDYNALGGTAFANAGVIVGRATFPKAAGTSFTAGEAVYWDTANTLCVVKNTSAQTSQVSLGVAIATASTATTSVDVYFYPAQP